MGRVRKLKKLSVNGDSLSIISECSEGNRYEELYDDMKLQEEESEGVQSDGLGPGLGPIQDPVAIREIQEFVKFEIKSAISQFAQMLCVQFAKSNFSESEAISKSIKVVEEQFVRSLGSVSVSHD